MKKILMLFFVALPLTVYSQFPDLAKTPPMGWNSWNAFELNINSKIVQAVADSMVSKGLAAAGYQYIVIDDGWQISRDKTGRIIADSTRFPEGIKYLADYVHSKGLKFGIYTCCGTKTCGGRPGSFGYETIDAKTYAEWGVDYIKEDWCFTDGLDTRTQYKIMSNAVKATGRHMLLSLCEWGVSSPWEWAKDIGAMWRTTSDIQDCFNCKRNWGGMGWTEILEQNVNLAPYAGPGHWNDPDMLEVGNKSLTPSECRSHFAMWCMLAAPLIAGNNISTMNDTIKDILTAPEIIAIDQDPLGIQGTRVRINAGLLQVWQKPLRDGSIAVALLNLSNSAAEMFVSLEEIGFKTGVACSVRDLWNRKELPSVSDSFKTLVKPHDIVVVKIKGQKALATKLEFDQTSIELNKGNHQWIHLIVYPSNALVKIQCSDNNTLPIFLAGVNRYKLTAKKVGHFTITASIAHSKLVARCNVTVKPASIPVPWKLNDIKDDKASADYDNGVFSIEGGGSDIWNATDQFAFLNQEGDHDAFISARVVSQTNTDQWAKTGLMFRESIAPNSKFVMIGMTPGNGVTLQWRDSTGGSCNKKDFKSTGLPLSFKLLKNGSTFNAYKSVDGNQWEPVGNISLRYGFAEKYLMGMEVLSHSSHMLNLSKFDQVNVHYAEKK
jgi:alpha-galactosidase